MQERNPRSSTFPKPEPEKSGLLFRVLTSISTTATASREDSVAAKPFPSLELHNNVSGARAPMFTNEERRDPLLPAIRRGPPTPEFLDAYKRTCDQFDSDDPLSRPLPRMNRKSPEEVRRLLYSPPPAIAGFDTFVTRSHLARRRTELLKEREDEIFFVQGKKPVAETNEVRWPEIERFLKTRWKDVSSFGYKNHRD